MTEISLGPGGVQGAAGARPAASAVSNSPNSPPAPSKAMNGGSAGSAPDSLIQQLRTAAALAQEVHEQDWPVGGEFGNKLWLMHQPLAQGPLDSFIAAKAESRDSGNEMSVTELNMDLIARSCVGVYGCHTPTGEKYKLSDAVGPLKLDHRLAVYLSMPLISDTEYTAREVIMMVFGNNPMAIVTYGDTLTEWMSDPSKKQDLGKSSAARS